MTTGRFKPGRIEVVDDEVAAILRSKTPGQRILMTGESWRSAVTWIRGVVRSRHADWDQDKIMAEVVRRLGLGPD